MERLNLTLMLMAIGVVAWILILFGPGTTTIHQGSYAIMILLFACLGAVVSMFPRPLLRLLVSLNVGYFIVVWLYGVYVPHYMSKAYLIYALLSCAAIAYCVARIAKREAWDKFS